jgi:aspartokinase-like uncharacterized kinase
MMTPDAVIKVGGSLYNVTDLGRRLLRWLETIDSVRPLLIPGGGPTAEAVRAFHRVHRVSEETCHWLALRALSLNAHFLADLLGRALVVEDLAECPRSWADYRLPILDLYSFARQDDPQPGRLAHSWRVTSDSLAARVAAVAGAPRLILLKSVSIPPTMSWSEAAQQGFVDAAFGATVSSIPTLKVEVINFRVWS